MNLCVMFWTDRIGLDEQRFICLLGLQIRRYVEHIGDRWHVSAHAMATKNGGNDKYFELFLMAICCFCFFHMDRIILVPPQN